MIQADLDASQVRISDAEDRRATAEARVASAQTDAERDAARATLQQAEADLETARAALDTALGTKATETAKKFQAEMDLERAKVSSAALSGTLCSCNSCLLFDPQITVRSPDLQPSTRACQHLIGPVSDRTRSTNRKGNKVFCC